jgi:NADH dehydrogenase [ubiquinone] 1 alpha subcomplex assembly factor 7
VQYRGGPVTVAEYMREVLSNPLSGFYAARGGAAIGARGHFVTSPEISSLFGEARSS